MRGRKHVPTVLKIIAGNPGGRPLPENEPDPVGDLYAPPDWMSDDQKAGWRYAIEHAPRGLLRRLDSALLAVWVVAENMHRKASEQIQKYGMIVKSGKQGIPVQSPYLPIVNRQAEIMMRAASELGFTPTSRSRITLGAGSKEKNRFANNAARRA